MAIMELHGLVMKRIIVPCMHMGMASMVLLQAVRAGGAPRCIQPPGPGHCLCVGLGGFTWL